MPYFTSLFLNKSVLKNIDMTVLLRLTARSKVRIKAAKVREKLKSSGSKYKYYKLITFNVINTLISSCYE